MIFDFIVSNINAWNKSVSILETVTYANKNANAVGSDYVPKENSIMSYSNSIAQIVIENNVCIYLTQRICCYVKEHSC